MTSLTDGARPRKEIGRRGFMAAGATTLGGAAVTLASLNEGRAAAAEPIKIGAAVPLTGFAAADGLEIKRGLEMGWDEVNSAGGILGRPVQLVIEDTKEFGAENVNTAIQRLIERDGVSAIVNAYNLGAETSEYDAVADAGIIYIHHNTDIIHHSTIAKDPNRYFGVFMGDPAEYWYGEGLLKFLNDLSDSGKFKYQKKTLALISGGQNYSVTIANAIADNLSKYGWTTTIKDTLGAQISEWGPTIQKLRNDPPAVIAITHWVPQDLAQFMIQFVPNPINSLIYMQYGPSIPAFRQIGKEAVNGIIYSTVVATLPDEIGTDFTQRYQAKYGKDAVALTAGMTYDSVHYLAIAAAVAGGLGAKGDVQQNRKVAAVLKKMIYRGVNGTTRFFDKYQAAVPYPDATRDPSLGMPHQFLQIQDYRGEPALIAPPPYDTAAFKLPPWFKG
jgi:branched-chain amino acid transport system substrate-binding protein